MTEPHAGKEVEAGCRIMGTIAVFLVPYRGGHRPVNCLETLVKTTSWDRTPIGVRPPLKKSSLSQVFRVSQGEPPLAKYPRIGESK